MQEIKRENFSFQKFFQHNYGLGNRPATPKIKKKFIVIGILAVIIGLIIIFSTDKSVNNADNSTVTFGTIVAIIGCIIIAIPTIKFSISKKYLADWTAELSRRVNTWWGEFDKEAAKIIENEHLKERGISYLAIDPDQLVKDEKNSTTAFSINGNNYDGGWRRKNNEWRTEYQEITWLYFSKEQIYIYKVRLSIIDPKNKREESLEFFYQDIVSVSIAQESVDLKGTALDGATEKQVDTERFRLAVPGDKLSFAYTPTTYASNCINQMKNTIREKKKS